MGQINEILKKYDREPNGHIIDLSWENGWTRETNDLFKELFELRKEGTYTRTGPASWQKMQCIISDSENDYTLKWQLDSGD